MSTPQELLQLYRLARTETHNTLFELVQEAAPKSVVYPQFMSDGNADNWANLLRSEADDNRVNCIQVFPDGLGETAGAPVNFWDPLLTFQVLFFYEDRLGVDSTNAQRELLDLAGDVQCYLRLFPDLKMLNHDNEDVRGCVSKHRGLSIPKALNPRKFGQTPAWLCPGKLEVELQSRRLTF